MILSGFREVMIGSLLVALTGMPVGPAAAVVPVASITFEPPAVSTPGSFAAVLNASAPGDVLLALDVTIVVDSGVLTLERYVTPGTMTAGFSGIPVDLAGTTASLIQGGQLSPPESGAVIKALLTAHTASSSTMTTVRFFGTLGLDQVGEVPFDVSGQIVLSPIPEPAVWLNRLFGLGFIVAFRQTIGAGNAVRPAALEVFGRQTS